MDNGMVAQRWHSFIGLDPATCEYAAYLGGVLIGRFPSYLSAEAAINRAQLEEAAQDAATVARLEAEQGLVVVELRPEPGSAFERAQRATDELFAA